jgi:hypothetical protein
MSLSTSDAGEILKAYYLPIIKAQLDGTNALLVKDGRAALQVLPEPLLDIPEPLGGWDEDFGGGRIEVRVEEVPLNPTWSYGSDFNNDCYYCSINGNTVTVTSQELRAVCPGILDPAALRTLAVAKWKAAFGERITYALAS